MPVIVYTVKLVAIPLLVKLLEIGWQVSRFDRV